MAQPKFQVFVSSTYEDLKEERDQVIKAILEMGHIPVGMEMFSAADEEQWLTIARHIDESDYYCVLVAHRYGSMTGNVSYTQKEYEYAVSQGVPVLGFIVDNATSWPPGKTDKATGTVAKLDAFKSLVRQKPVSTWKSPDDLYGKVGISLGKQIALTLRPGWIRTPPGASADVTAELTRLSAENASLRAQVERVEAKAESDQASELRDVWRKMNDNYRRVSYRYKIGDRSWQQAERTSLTELFYILSANLFTEVELNDAASALAMELRADAERAWDIVAINQVRSLLADLSIFGIVRPSTKKHPVADSGEYWQLTELGRELHKMLRMRMLSFNDDDEESDKESGEDVAEADGSVVKAAAKKAAAKKAAAKKAAAKKTPAKKTAAKKTPAKKTPAKKTATE